MTNFAPRCEARSTPSAKQCTKERGHDGPHYSAEMFVAWDNNEKPTTIQLRASAHIAMRAWLEAEFGADELHEQRIVSAMRELREQTGLAAAEEALQRLRGYATNFARPHGMDKCEVVDLDTIASAIDNELALLSQCEHESGNE
jgi:hypothetical protein